MMAEQVRTAGGLVPPSGRKLGPQMFLPLTHLLRDCGRACRATYSGGSWKISEPLGHFCVDGLLPCKAGVRVLIEGRYGVLWLFSEPVLPMT